MSRPQKTGLDYFPLDVHMDENVELLEVDCGLEGFAILIKLYQRIYDNGYYIHANERRIKLLSRIINVDINRINDVINSALEYGIFDKNLYKKYKILTSSGIQKRYFPATERRLSVAFKKEYFLLNINDYNNLINVDINSENVDSNPAPTGLIHTEVHKAKQSKVNQSKVKNSRQQSAFSSEGNTRASPDFAAADFLSSDVLKSRCKDSTGLILKPPEIAIILNSLKAQNLGEAFLEFLFARIRKNSDVNKPAGFLKHLLLNLGDFEDYVGDFRKIKNKPHVPKRPEIPKCFCKGEIRDGGDVCQCSNCGAMWELVDNSWRTVPKAEIPDISGIFKKKSAFQPESKAI